MKILGTTTDGNFIVILSQDEINQFSLKNINDDDILEKWHKFQSTESYNILSSEMPKGARWKHPLWLYYRDGKIDGSLQSAWKLTLIGAYRMGEKSRKTIKETLERLNVPKPINFPKMQ